jgi:hypothetical protein
VSLVVPAGAVRDHPDLVVALVGDDQVAVLIQRRVAGQAEAGRAGLATVGDRPRKPLPAWGVSQPVPGFSRCTESPLAMYTAPPL